MCPVESAPFFRLIQSDFAIGASGEHGQYRFVTPAADMDVSHDKNVIRNDLPASRFDSETVDRTDDGVSPSVKL
jgi:hypothetical protein